MIERKPNHWARLTALLFLLMAVSGFLRVFGALRESSVLLEFGLSKVRLGYLIGAGVVYGFLNLTALVFILWRSRLRIWVAWGAAILSIALYWFERFVLWVPEQRSGNILFMVLLHLALLLVLIFFWLNERKGSSDSK